MCQHQPSCPSAEAPGRSAARVVAAHPEQGWNLLCNGVVLFDDTGELLPDGHVVAPQASATYRRPPLRQPRLGKAGPPRLVCQPSSVSQPGRGRSAAGAATAA